MPTMNMSCNDSELCATCMHLMVFWDALHENLSDTAAMDFIVSDLPWVFRKGLVHIRSNKTNLLCKAASQACGPAVKYLIEECGASVDHKGWTTRDGTEVFASPLWLASSMNHPDVVLLLLEHGASVDSCAHPLSTPLHIACCEGYQETAELLMSFGADVNAKDVRGETCLMSTENNGLINSLLENGASVNEVSEEGKTALTYSIERDNPDSCEALIGRWRGYRMRQNQLHCYGRTE